MIKNVYISGLLIALFTAQCSVEASDSSTQSSLGRFFFSPKGIAAVVAGASLVGAAAKGFYDWNEVKKKAMKYDARDEKDIYVTNLFLLQRATFWVFGVREAVELERKESEVGSSKIPRFKNLPRWIQGLFDIEMMQNDLPDLDSHKMKEDAFKIDNDREKLSFYRKNARDEWDYFGYVCIENNKIICDTKSENKKDGCVFSVEVKDKYLIPRKFLTPDMRQALLKQRLPLST